MLYIQESTLDERLIGQIDLKLVDDLSGGKVDLTYGS
jgi:hypothetical protein